MKHTTRKWIALLLAFLMVPWGVFAETAETIETETGPVEATVLEGTGEYTVECRTYPYLRTFDDEEITESTMNLYFIDGVDIPYVSLSEYMDFYYALMQDYDEWDDMSFEIERVDEDDGSSAYFVTRSDNSTSMLVIPKVDEIWFDSYNLFMVKPGVSSLVAALDLPETEQVDIWDAFQALLDEADEMKARGEEVPEDFFDELFASADPATGRNFFINDGGSYNRHGNGTYLSPGEYGIDLYSIGGECYIPFQTMNDLFMNNQYLQYIFNEEMVIGASYGRDLLQRAREAEPAEMSFEYASFNYRELLFLLDTFYGLKPEHDIDGFRVMIDHNRPLYTGLLSGMSADFDNALMMLLGFYLDDLHSGFLANSWRTPEEEDDMAAMSRFFGSMGHSTQASMMDSVRFTCARDDFYPDGVPGYEEIGDTAFVTFDSFSTSAIKDDIADYYDLGVPETLEECGTDTIRLIQYANEQILREESPIRNVVIDLSNNGGGSVAAAVAVMCWYLGTAKFALHDTMTGALSIMNYRCDLNVNERSSRDENDSLDNKDLKLYCLVSPVSFSCGNLVPAFFKDSHVVTLIGQRTGGGSCVVLPCTSASGALFQISGTKQIALVRNGSFYNVDQGVEPDILLTRAESFYDREALVKLINSTP